MATIEDEARDLAQAWQGRFYADVLAILNRCDRMECAAVAALAMLALAKSSGAKSASAFSHWLTTEARSTKGRG